MKAKSIHAAACCVCPLGAKRLVMSGVEGDEVVAV